ncbi:MAG: hypothetical protein ACOYXR_13325 [Nitrospirota bacterium]
MEQPVTAPSKLAIVRATLVACLLALALLVGVVLPAEYGLDPTGTGDVLGLTDLGKAKAAGAAARGFQRTRSEPQKYREDTVTLTIEPGQGLEYKFRLVAGGTMLYSWTATDTLIYDFHGEPQNATNGYFESYEKSENRQGHGSLVASFEGTHGWWVKNPGVAPVTMTLTTAGYYDVVGIPHHTP